MSDVDTPGWRPPPPSYMKWAQIGFKLLYEGLTMPLTVVVMFFGRRLDPAYGMTWGKKFALGWRMWSNGFRIFSGTSYKAHLAMAVKLLEMSPDIKGVVVECGCWQGGSTANLSLVCDIVGRELIVYDTFEGMPPPKPGDKYALPTYEGTFRGEYEQVVANVTKCGAVECCTFRKGLFADTLPHHTEPIVLAFLDVDYQASLHDCILNLWPHLRDRGYVFIDEYTRIDYCALFFSERYWKTYFDTSPPGLLGSGIGVAMGQYFIGPHMHHAPFETASSVAYTRKDFSGLWTYYPEEHETSA